MNKQISGFEIASIGSHFEDNMAASTNGQLVDPIAVHTSASSYNNLNIVTGPRPFGLTSHIAPAAESHFVNPASLIHQTQPATSYSMITQTNEAEKLDISARSQSKTINAALSFKNPGSTKINSHIQHDKFTLFPNLSPELRIMIWEVAYLPRLVGFTKESNGPVPGVFHANRESRSVSKYYFEMKDFGTGLFINPKLDIVHLDEGSFSRHIFYHATAMHTLDCGAVRISMTKDVERVAISARELASMQKMGCVHCQLKHFKTRFPSLKELILILRRGPTPVGVTVEDLYYVDSGNGHDHLQHKIDKFTRDFEKLQRGGYCLDVEFKFMRNEKWEDLTRNALPNAQVVI